MKPPLNVFANIQIRSSFLVPYEAWVARYGRGGRASGADAGRAKPFDGLPGRIVVEHAAAQPHRSG